MKDRGEELRLAFDAFHQKHPEVFTLFYKFAEEVYNLGYRRHSADAIMHRVRWETNIMGGRAEGEQFKVNDNHVAFYARLLVELDDRFKDFFQFRRSAADKQSGGK